ncbi:hypothetical protein PVAND_000905 [Polypedilum vanderplanki]|uniref:Uncharacterized protein n=1 Tax=Polypedilum vanderplanki TaxID=319348 RepID=A0A9J6BLA3_POLVA|nr:hypothetical protein PVAND_000905 [Polypedilum vanderplanki]
MTQELICDFKYEGWQFLKKTYICVIKNQKFENFELNLQGKHLNELSNKDVSAVFLIKCSMEKIPIYTKIFPNMKHLMILMSDLTHIESDDFKEYTQLTQLYMTKIEITFMSKNLFENLKNLKILSLFDIKVDLIEPETFDDMNQLEIVELYNCGFKNMLYSVYNSNPGNASLEDIKNEIFLKYQKTNWKKISKELLKDEALNEIKIILPQIMKENKITENLKLSDVSSITFCAIINFTLNNELSTSNKINFIHLLIISEKFKIKN